MRKQVHIRIETCLQNLETYSKEGSSLLTDAFRELSGAIGHFSCGVT